MNRKLKISVLLVILACLFSGIQANAYFNESEWFDSPNFYADEWTSYKDTSYQVVLTSQFGDPSTGDVGIEFGLANEGLPDNFVESYDRTATFKLLESDGWWSSPDLCVTYECEFYYDLDGFYQMNPIPTNTTYRAAVGIEDTEEIELYIEGWVDNIPGDLSYTFPIGMFRYMIWTN